MTTGGRKGLIRLRAASALLMLTLAWVWGPVEAATRGTNVCAMDCCVEEGHCCCTPANPYVLGQSPPAGDLLDRAAISSRCPDGCATPTSASKTSPRAALRAPAHWAASPAPVAPERQTAEIIHDPFTAQKSSPRGPPSFLLVAST